MSWARVVVCGIVAGAVWTLLSVTLLALVGGEFASSIPGGLQELTGSAHMALLAANLVAGVWAIWLYVFVRARNGPGLRSILVTGLGWWAIVSLQSAKWLLILGVAVSAALGLLTATLVAILISTFVGVWTYERQPRRTVGADDGRT